jgi:hypothetical protein
VVRRFLHPRYRADASGKDWKNPSEWRCNLSGNVNRVFIIRTRCGAGSHKVSGALDRLKTLRGAVVLLGFDPPPVGDRAAADPDSIGLGA